MIMNIINNNNNNNNNKKQIKHIKPLNRMREKRLSYTKSNTAQSKNLRAVW